MKRSLLLLIGLLVAVLIPVVLGGGETWARLQSFPLRWLLLMFGMILLCWGINTLRLRLLLATSVARCRRSRASAWSWPQNSPTAPPPAAAADR